MSSSSEKLATQLNVLNASLDDLESALEPLFEQPLTQLLPALSKVQQAKLQTVIPYVAYDLVFMYLKTRGIDPKSHHIVTELARIKQYFDKIADAEKHLHSHEQDQPRMAVDQDAAARFIKQAIAESSHSGNPSQQPEPQPSTFVPAKTTEKMIQRQKYQDQLRELGDDHNDKDANSDDDDLEFIDDQDTPVEVETETPVTSGVKRKTRDVPNSDPSSLKKSKQPSGKKNASSTPQQRQSDRKSRRR